MRDAHLWWAQLTKLLQCAACKGWLFYQLRRGQALQPMAPPQMKMANKESEVNIMLLNLR